VVVDPVRARRALGLETGPGFSPDVEYIYQKQLEEAQVIVINKSDLLDPAALEELDRALAERFAEAVRFTISARRGMGLAPWLDHLRRHSLPAAEAMELDYDRYARGEASLGWLNCTLRADAPRPFDPDRLLLELARCLHRALANGHHQVAHLKMTFAPDDAPEVAVVNLVRNDVEPELARRIARPASAGRLVLNLRAEAAPEPIRGLVERTLEDARGNGEGDEYRLRVERLVCFQPARPQPTHRLVRLETGR
jgi:G3E family GTPase